MIEAKLELRLHRDPDAALARARPARARARPAREYGFIAEQVDTLARAGRC